MLIKALKEYLEANKQVRAAPPCVPRAGCPDALRSTHAPLHSILPSLLLASSSIGASSVLD